MKSILHSLAAVFLSCALAVPLRAGEPAAPAPAPMGKWNVRVEVLMVSLPEEKALALLPDLHDDAKIDAACAQLLAAVKRKEAVLTGNPIVQTLEEQESRSETNLEKIYPTQFSPPNSPTGFEKRNVGPLLQTLCRVSPGGDWIQVQALVQRTELLGFDSFESGPAINGVVPRVEQPRFFCAKVANTFAIQNGKRLLVGVHKPVTPEGNLEFFILQASATRAAS